MDSGLEAIRMAMRDKDFADARTRSTAYCAEHPELAARFTGLTIPVLVSMVDEYRANGDEDNRMAVEVWLLANHAPQSIVGSTSV